MNIELISKRLKIIEDMQEELKKIRNSIQDALESDADFQALQETVNQNRVAVKESRDRISEKAIIKELEAQMKEKRKELKEIKEVLSQELADYYRSEGSMEVEDHNGDIKRMKFSVSLVS
jgi:hypothetical protein